MSACSHGDRVKVTGRSKGRMWAGLLCPAKDQGCGPEWVPDTEVYAFWKDSSGAVSVSNDVNDVNEDKPPF